MANTALSWTQYTEAVVGLNHPTLTDVDNRALRQMLNRSGFGPDQVFRGLPVGNSAVNAGSSDYTGTKEVRITAAIADAVAASLPYCFVPRVASDGTSLLPYNASLVTFNTSVRMVREGGNPRWYDVLAYGAYTDSVTDSSVSIQAADTAAESTNGTVYFPAYTYRVSGIAGTVNNAGSLNAVGNVAFKIAAPVHWMGEPGAILQWAFNVASFCFVYINPAGAAILGSQQASILIEGLTIDANSGQGGFGVVGYWTQNVTVRNCRFTRFGQGGGNVPYAVRFDGSLANPPNPYVWTNAAPATFGRGNQVLFNNFDNFTNAGANTANPIFYIEQDGGLIQGNTCWQTGEIMVQGVNRGIRIMNNAHEDGWDNGIRLQVDGVGDNQRSRDHIVIGNRIRNAVIDGIRLNCTRVNCVGNTSEGNGNSGIKSDSSNELVIEGNTCLGNTNNGIYLAKATIAGQGGHDGAIISNNVIVDDLNNGINVQGSGDTGLIPATNIRILGNRCFRCAVQGIRVDDADSRLQVIGNSSGEHGAAGGAGYGFLIQAINLSWGGATLAFNRSVGLVTGVAATAKQPFGIGFIAATGKTLSKCYAYFNDLSDHPDTSTFSGTAISTTANAGGGTVNGQFLVGTLYRNCTRGVNAAAVVANGLQTTDIIIQVDEGGQLIAGLNSVVQDRGFVVTAVATQAVNVLNGTYQEFNITSNIAVVLQTPTNNPATNVSQELTVTFFNNSGGALATAPTFATGAGAFLTAAAVVNPANTTGVTYVFRWSPTAAGGARWREVARTVAF